jgi:hypothetical protein
MATSDLLDSILNSTPEESDYALIGRIALQQNALEYQLESLVWHYMEDVDKGHIATALLGCVQKTDMLATFVEWVEPDDHIAEAITWAIESFHILRINRNAVIHGYNFRADRKAGKLMIERRTKSLVFDSFQQFEINRKVLEQICADQSNLAMYLWRVQGSVERRPAGLLAPNPPPLLEHARLPAKPVRPASLSPLPHEVPKSARTLRRELAETDAKQAKLDRKESQRRAARGEKK